jgi:hypothetical protein
MGDNRKRRARLAALAAGALLAGAAAVSVHGVVDTPDNRDWSVDAAPAGQHEGNVVTPAGHVEGG